MNEPKTLKETINMASQWGKNKIGYTNHLYQTVLDFINTCQNQKEVKKARKWFKNYFGREV